jgi:gephyrin
MCDTSPPVIKSTDYGCASCEISPPIPTDHGCASCDISSNLSGYGCATCVVDADTKSISKQHGYATCKVSDKFSNSQNEIFDMKVNILVVSDRCSRGEAKDMTGPAVFKFIEEFNAASKDCVRMQLGNCKLVPDEKFDIEASILTWICKIDSKDVPHVIFTFGGTGFSPRDITSDVVAKLIDRPAPGLVHTMLHHSMLATPMAALSRPVAGIKNNTIIITLPGNPKAVHEILTPLMKLLPHAVKLINQLPTSH